VPWRWSPLDRRKHVTLLQEEPFGVGKTRAGLVSYPAVVRRWRISNTIRKMTPAATRANSVNRLQPRGRGIDFGERVAGELGGDCSCGVTAGGSGVRIIVTDHDGGNGWSVDGPGVPLLTKTESFRPAKDELVSPVRGCESGFRSDGEDDLVGPPTLECG